MSAQSITLAPTESTKDINLTLNKLRLLAKSVSKTRDAELKKLGRLSPHSKIHADVKADYQELDEVAAEIDIAISELVAES